PLAGESVFEALERAGNYGVPLALFLSIGASLSWKGLVQLRDAPSADERVQVSVRGVLQWTTVLLLLGHGALGALVGKGMFATHYAAIGLPAQATAMVGWFEIALAVGVAVRPIAGLLIFVAAWKLATESLFLAAGAPIWEVVERAGSYAAPLALAALAARTRER